MLVTLSLICFNHERFIRDAVHSAFSQEYERLEILISDDCSTDNTFNIIEEEVARYGGPHTVRILKNKEHLGMENWSRAAKQARGEFVVGAQGDDVSFPFRTRRLVNVWAKTGASLLSSNNEIIDAEGAPLGLYKSNSTDTWISSEEIANNGYVSLASGSTLAWHRDVFSLFRYIDRSRLGIGYDQVLPFRAAMLNGVYYVAEPLIKHRLHSHNIWKGVTDKTQDSLIESETKLAYRLVARICMLDDMNQFIADHGKPAGWETLEDIFNAGIYDLTRKWANSRNLLYANGKRPTWIDQTEALIKLKYKLAAKGTRKSILALLLLKARAWVRKPSRDRRKQISPIPPNTTATNANLQP